LLCPTAAFFSRYPPLPMSSVRPFLSRLASVLVCVCASLPALRGQVVVTPPAWWAERGVLAGLPTDDNAVVTADQLYNFALAALLELNGKLATVGGAGTSLSAALGVVGAQAGLHSEYFDNSDFAGVPVFTRLEAAVAHDWNDGGNRLSPVPGLGTTDYTVRWVGEVVAEETGFYLFDLHSEGGGARLWVNGGLVADWWGEDTGGDRQVVMALTGGDPATVRLEYRASSDSGQPTRVQARWGVAPNLADPALMVPQLAYGAHVTSGWQEQWAGELWLGGLLTYDGTGHAYYESEGTSSPASGGFR
jgi:hypothetical protein